MQNTVIQLLKKHGITAVASVALADTRIVRPYLLERAGISTGTAFLFAVPYYTTFCEVSARNISAYAVSPDYHAFFASLFEEILPALKSAFPAHRFAGFTDHSPLAEVDAAVRAGLGVRGDNGLLLTEAYGSYQFIGEIITDMEVPATPTELKECLHCGRCRRACPASEATPCLSALTQKKGTLDEKEKALLLEYRTAWGCDLCQTVCPYNERAKKAGTIYTAIPFFKERPLPHLTADAVRAMSEEEFKARAFSWRGKETILRNLTLLEKGEG